MTAAYRWIQKIWYDDAISGWLLMPLSGVFWLLIALRKLLYQLNIFKTHKAQATVIVVGNITAGGTGKTPIVLWLVDALRSRGFKPGIVSRGYGGNHSGASMRVDVDSAASLVGDEPVLLAKRGQCPVVVDSDRVRAAAMLVDDGVDLIIADDGLQHMRLQRDFEICVVDGARGLGNCRLLPSGPLREPVRRLNSVDQILVNGGGQLVNGLPFDLQAGDAVRINASVARPLQGFKGTTVHAVAGIGNPQRFFDLLQSYGIQVIEHSLVDHAALKLSDLKFGDDFDVFMTEKDAVKIERNVADKFWYVPVDVVMNDDQSAELLDRIETRLRDEGEIK